MFFVFSRNKDVIFFFGKVRYNKKSMPYQYSYRCIENYYLEADHYNRLKSLCQSIQQGKTLPGIFARCLHD